MTKISAITVAVTMCMVLLSLPAAAQSGGTPLSEMSDSELGNSFGDTLREYDSNNDGEIGINEVGDVGTDFAKSELSLRKAEAVREAFDRGLRFDTQTEDGSESEEEDQTETENPSGDSVREMTSDTWYGVEPGSSQTVVLNPDVNGGAEATLKVKDDNSLEIAKGDNQVTVGVGQVEDIGSILDKEQFADPIMSNCGMVDDSEGTYISGRINLRFGPAEAVGWADYDYTKGEVLSPCLSHRYETQSKDIDLSQGSSRYIYINEDKKYELNYPSQTKTLKRHPYLDKFETFGERSNIELTPGLTRSHQNYYFDSKSDVDWGQNEDGIIYPPGVRRLKLSRINDYSLEGWKKDVRTDLVADNQDTSITPTTIYQVPTKKNVHYVKLTGNNYVYVNGEKKGVSGPAGLPTQNWKNTNRVVLKQTDEAAIVLWAVHRRTPSQQFGENIEEAGLMAVPANRVEDAYWPSADISLQSNRNVFGPGDNIEFVFEHTEDAKGDYKVVADGPENTKTFEPSDAYETFSFTPEAAGTLELTVKTSEDWFLFEEKELASQTADVVEGSPEASAQIGTALVGYDTNLKANFYSQGEYRIEISGAGVNKQETYSATTSTPGDDSWEHKKYDIEPTKSGELKAKIVAPGSLWNPFDNDQEVSSDTATVLDPERIDVEAGERFTLNQTSPKRPLLESRAATLPDGTSIIPGGYYQVGPPYDEEPESMTLLVNTSSRTLALDDPDKDLPVNRQITIGDIQVRLCGYKSPADEFEKQPRFAIATKEITSIHSDYLVNKCNGEAVDLSNAPVSMSNQELFNEYGDVIRKYDADNSAAYSSDEIDNFVEAAKDGEVTDLELRAINVAASRDISEELWLPETEDGEGEEEDTQGISVDVASQKPYNVGQEIEFEALGENGDAEFEWDFNQNHQPDTQGSTATYTYTEEGQKTIQLNLSDQSVTAQTTITVQSQTGDDETSSQQTELSVSTSKPYTTDKEVDLSASAADPLAGNGYSIEVSGPDGFSESKDVSEPEAELSFTPPSSGTYTAEVVPQSFANGLPFVEEIVQSGAKAETSFEVDGADASAWINYCNGNGYDIESLDQDLGVAGSCVSEEIVPAFFVESGDSQDTQVPESLCQEVLGTGYVENQRACGTPGAA